MKTTRLNLNRRGGFTLVEIMIVVFVIGLLAAMAIPAFAKARKRTQQATFVNDIRILGAAAEYYSLSQGQFLEDSSSGAIPTGLSDYIEDDKWLDGTPLGGVWDAELNDNGITSGIGVHFNNGLNPGDAFMREIDTEFDDGNLYSGVFQKIADDRYYYIVAE